MPDDPCFLEQSDAEGIPRIWANLSWSDEGFFAAVQFTKPHQRAVGCWWVRVTGTHPDKPFLVEGIAPTGRRGVGEVHVGTIDPRKLEAGVSWHIAGGRSYAPSTG